MALPAEQKVELLVKRTFLVFADGSDDKHVDEDQNEATRRRSLSDAVVQYGEYDDGMASLETSSPREGSDTTDTDVDEPGTSTPCISPNPVNTEGYNDSVNATAVPIYYCIPVPVLPVTVCWPEQPVMVEDLQNQAAQFHFHSQEAEMAAHMAQMQAHGFQSAVLPDSRARASKLDIAAKDLKIQAREAEEAAQHLRSKARDLQSSCSSAMAGNCLDRNAMDLKAQAQKAEATALLLRTKAKDLRIQQAELASAAELESQALKLRRLAQEAEEGAQLARSKAGAPWCQRPTSGSNARATETVPLNADSLQASSEEEAPAISKSWCGGEEGSSPVEPTTLMLRNVPNGYTRDMILQLLDDEGFQGSYDLLYVPWDFNRLAGLGYAFVNFTSTENAERAMRHLQGFNDWRVESQKMCEVVWGSPLQGLHAHVEHYRNTPVMHKSVPECYKPALFKDGQRQAFPAPTKSVRAPRMRRGGIPSK